MTLLKTTFEMDKKSYNDPDTWRDCQNEILQLLEDGVSKGAYDPSIFVSLAAVLSNLGQHRKALQVLQQHPSDSQAYCENVAIATVNTSGGKDQVREWNKKA